MERILIHPPLADPTQPYLSLPTLKGHLREHGLDARVIDLNVEAAHFLLERESLTRYAERIGARFLALNDRDELGFEEQREYRAVVASRPEVEDLLAASPTPIEVFQDKDRFYDAAEYSLARERFEALFRVVSAAHFPYRFGFNRLDREVVPWGFDLLSEYGRSESSPFLPLYRRIFDPPEDWNTLASNPLWCDLSEVDFIGISVIFPSQFAEAFLLARFLKERTKSAFVAIGGPSIHQSVVHMIEPLRKRLFEFVDGVGLFEGEALLTELFPRLAAWRGSDAKERGAALASVPNLLMLDPGTGSTVLGPRHNVDVRRSPPPDYSDLDLDRYLAPTRTLLYAPTRGCYWGKCSFCYYGLTETATATYREVPPDIAAADLLRLSQRYGVKNFYLSCDVLAPRYAVQLAQALEERGSNLRWHCDLKIEPYFDEARAALLYRSGMRAAAFGIESGSDRILELMRKGCDRATMTEVNRRFADAGIATQWMTFTDHPDETVDEALATVSWIEQESESIALFLVGEFGLEQGSHIAQDPSRYGVKSIYFAEGDDFRLYALFEQMAGRRSSDAAERVDSAIGRAARPFSSRPYPWAGAISTHHTFLHVLRFGNKAFKTHFKSVAPKRELVSIDQALSHIAGLRRRPRFHLAAIENAEAEFFQRFLSKALYSTLPARRGFGQGQVAPLTISNYLAAAAEVRPLRAFHQQA